MPNESAPPADSAPNAAATGAPSGEPGQKPDAAPAAKPDAAAPAPADGAKPDAKPDASTPPADDAAKAEAERVAGIEKAATEKAEKAAAEKAEQTVAQAKSDMLAAAMADPEFGGDKFAEATGVAKMAVEAFFKPEFAKFLNDTGLGNHPEMIRGFLKIGSQMKQDGFVPGGKQTPDKGAQSFYNNSTMNP